MSDKREHRLRRKTYKEARNGNIGQNTREKENKSNNSTRGKE